MNVGVIGSGYVGLVAGACFAESGNSVICADIDESKIAGLNNGKVPIYEPGLDELIKSNVEHGRLTFTTDLENTIKSSDIIFIAVGTPQDEDGSADLSYVISVAETIGKHMNEYKVVVTKSTVPVGTAKLVKEAIEKQTDISFDVVSNPEFLKEGSAIDDFMKPDRVVIGTSSEKAAGLMKDLYDPFVRTNNPIFIMDNASAEVTKYAANALLATKITFMNEIANLCEEVGADVSEVRQGVGSDNRIGPSFLFPGVGYGGSCFPKDVRALMRTGAGNKTPLDIIAAVDRINEKQKERLPIKIAKHYGSVEAVKGKHFAIWGLSFKPNTDDMREAPSITIIRRLLEFGATVTAYDPEAMEEAKHTFEKEGLDVNLVSSSYEALKGADALVIITDWNEFKRPDFDKLKEELIEPLIFDGRNLFSLSKMKELGFKYHSIGRPIVGC